MTDDTANGEEQRRSLRIVESPDETADEALARTVIDPVVIGTLTRTEYARTTGLPEASLNCLIARLRANTDAFNSGDTEHVETMLIAQAHTLDQIFNTLAGKAAQNMGEYLSATETYLKLALKAQSQCRATLREASRIKNPPLAGYVGQANIAHGPQQVNNGPINKVVDEQNQENELLEHQDGERLDFGETRTAVGDDSAMEAVGAVNGAENARGQSDSKP